MENVASSFGRLLSKLLSPLMLGSGDLSIHWGVVWFCGMACHYNLFDDVVGRGLMELMEKEYGWQIVDPPRV